MNLLGNALRASRNISSPQKFRPRHVRVISVRQELTFCGCGGLAVLQSFHLVLHGKGIRRLEPFQLIHASTIATGAPVRLALVMVAT